MITKFVYILFADSCYFAKAFSEDESMELLQTMKEIFPIGTVFEMRIYKLVEVKKNDK